MENRPVCAFNKKSLVGVNACVHIRVVTYAGRSVQYSPRVSDDVRSLWDEESCIINVFRGNV